jgi:hypothetical protein
MVLFMEIYTDDAVAEEKNTKLTKGLEGQDEDSEDEAAQDGEDD